MRADADVREHLSSALRNEELTYDELQELVCTLTQLAATHPLHATLEHQVLAAGSELVDA